MRLGPSELLARPGRFLPLCGDVLEFLAGCLKDGLQSADRMKPPKDHITIKRVELDAKTAAPSPLGSDQRRARAGKGIENDAFTARAVAYRDREIERLNATSALRHGHVTPVLMGSAPVVTTVVQLRRAYFLLSQG